MTKKELEKLINKILNGKVTNDVVRILRNLNDIVSSKLLDIYSKYYKCESCGKWTHSRRWKNNKCPLCGKF